MDDSRVPGRVASYVLTTNKEPNENIRSTKLYIRLAMVQSPLSRDSGKISIDRVMETNGASWENRAPRHVHI